MRSLRANSLFFKICLFLISLLLAASVLPPAAARADNAEESADGDNGKIVYMIDINEEFSNTMVSFVERSLKNAEKDQADYFLVVLNASSDYDKFAEKVSELLLASKVPTICYVSGRAFDGAALAVFSCDTVIMAPGSDFGTEYNSEGSKVFDSYDREYWLQVFQDTLEQAGRTVDTTPDHLANSNLYSGTFSDMGEVNIYASTALKMGLADYEATSVQVILNDYGLSDGVIIQEEKNFIEICTDVLSSPLIATILLAIGLGALVAEIVFSGYGITGLTGFVCLVLYLFGGYKSGNAEGYVAFWLLASFILLMIEFCLSPGNGVCGGFGAIGFCTSIMFIANNAQVAFIQMLIVFIVVVILIMVNSKEEKNKNIFRKLVLRDKTTTEEGYLSQPINIRDYLGQEGVALTALRPAGAVKIGAERVDVVTEGDFIAAGDRVKVIKVDGSSVIVRRM